MGLIRFVLAIAAVSALGSWMSHLGVESCSASGPYFPWGCGTAWYLALLYLAAAVALFGRFGASRNCQPTARTTRSDLRRLAPLPFDAMNPSQHPTATISPQVGNNPGLLIELVAKHHDVALPVTSIGEGVRMIAHLEAMQQDRYAELAGLSPSQFERMKTSAAKIADLYVHDPLRLRDGLRRYQRSARWTAVGAGLVGAIGGLRVAALTDTSGDMVGVGAEMIRSTGWALAGAGVAFGALAAVRIFIAWRMARMLVAQRRDV